MGKGLGDIQRNALTCRPDLKRLIQRHMGKSVKLVPEAGMLCVEFEKPILNKDLYDAVRKHFVVWDTPRDNKVACGSVSILASTGKMGTWGFSLPAGPPSLYGSCHGATLSFPVEQPAKPAQISPQAVAAGFSAPNYICRHCYACKGRYGSPMILITIMTRMVLVDSLLAAGEGKFADVMEQAIVMGQAKSIRAYRFLEKTGRIDKEGYAIWDPNFFRIHDSGDFHTKKYLREWFEIARRFEKGRTYKGLKLPRIIFWAPTRTWTVSGKLGIPTECPGVEDMTCAPPNMVIRPSAMQFRQRAPNLEKYGYDAGATSGAPEVWKKIAKWQCPAYLRPEEGGGAELKRGKWIQGCCSRSRGPFAGRKPKSDERFPRGHGCRACWLYPEMSVAYQEH